MRLALYDRWGSYVGELQGVTSAKLTRSTSGTDQLEVTSTTQLVKDDRVLVQDGTGTWREYMVRGTDVERGASSPRMTAVCVNSVAELSRRYITEQRNRGGTAAGALAKLLDGTRWARGTVDGTAAKDTSFYHQSALASIYDLCDAYALELDATVEVSGSQVSRRLVHLRNRLGADTHRRFEYRRDLVSVRRTVSADDVVTRLYGWGKGVEQTDAAGNATGGYSRKISFADVNGGKAYVEDADATQRFGLLDAQGRKVAAEGQFEDGDCDDPRELLAETRAQLAKVSQPTVSYEADVLALARAGFAAEGVDVGDSVQIVDTAFDPPLRLEGRVLEVTEELMGPLTGTSIKLGNIVETMSQRTGRVNDAVKRLAGSAGGWDDAATLRTSYVEEVINGLNAVLNEVGGYTYLKPGQGIFVYDRPEDKGPSMAIQIGGGYFRIADGKNSDGTWKWRTLGTGHGLVADEIVTGRITAGQNYIDLDKGEVSLSASTPVGGKTVSAIAQEKADAAKQAAQAYVDALDESLGQRSVFDRLTNNGQVQGIYLDNGKVYLNGEYIKTGVIDAALVKAGILTDDRGLNFWDMTTGELSISLSTKVGGSTVATSSDLDSSASRIQSALGSKVDQVSGTVGNVSSRVSEIESYVRIETDDDGSPVLRLGSSGSDLMAALTNSELGFYDSGVRVAYIGGRKLMIENAEVKQNLQFGSWAFFARANGNMALKWVGNG